MTPGEHAELAILQTLADGLPGDYELFHGVGWADLRPGRDLHGEIDIVVVNRAGDVALLEVKAGDVMVNESGVFKRYGGQTKSVSWQVARQRSAVRHRLGIEGLGGVRQLHVLVLPDQKVSDEGAIAFPRERIADATDCLDLAGFVQRRLGAGLPDEALKDRVCAFFANRLGLEPDVSVLCGQLRERVARISGGLASWVPRIEAPSRVIRVRATAGSGKTQLALRLLTPQGEVGRQAAYVCFNRPLADHVRDIAPRAALVTTFHGLCWEAAGRPAVVENYEALVQSYMQAPRPVADWDVLVIDELQDMCLEWVQALVSQLRPDARLYLLDDPSQCLYDDRDEIVFPDAVEIRSQENYRSPRRLVDTINLLRLTPQPVQACGPLDGEDPGLRTYGPNEGSLARATAQAVERCLELGYALADITVLCWRGLGSSRLMGAERLAGWRLTRFGGGYDEQGRPIWSEGELRIETVRRFKGQSSSAVVLTEVDFDELGAMERNLLFVALTRARMHVEIVMSEAAEKALTARLGMGDMPE
jgi:hypothetical protein